MNKLFPADPVTDEMDESMISAVFELEMWQRRSATTNFSALLYDLIAKADQHNFARLTIAFPFHVQAYVLWQRSPDPDVFFSNWQAYTAQKRLQQ